MARHYRIFSIRFYIKTEFFFSQMNSFDTMNKAIYVIIIYHFSTLTDYLLVEIKNVTSCTTWQF